MDGRGAGAAERRWWTAVDLEGNRWARAVDVAHLCVGGAVRIVEPERAAKAAMSESLYDSSRRRVFSFGSNKEKEHDHTTPQMFSFLPWVQPIVTACLISAASSSVFHAKRCPTYPISTALDCERIVSLRSNRGSLNNMPTTCLNNEECHSNLQYSTVPHHLFGKAVRARCLSLEKV